MFHEFMFYLSILESKYCQSPHLQRTLSPGLGMGLPSLVGRGAVIEECYYKGVTIEECYYKGAAIKE